MSYSLRNYLVSGVLRFERGCIVLFGLVLDRDMSQVNRGYFTISISFKECVIVGTTNFLVTQDQMFDV